MKNTRRRTRRKNRSRTRSHRSKRAVQALAAGAMIAAGTQAYANPIRFDNPPGAEHFDWIPAGPGDESRWLDVVAPASSQPGDANSFSSFKQRFGPSGGTTVLTAWGEIQGGGPYDVFLLGVNSGDLIPSGFSWLTEAYVYYPGFGSQLPEGEGTYLGVRFDLGAGNQYGWIGVVRTGMELDAFAWGYETEVGVSIPAGAIPEPGTLAALALGAAALLGRRRSRSQID